MLLYESNALLQRYIHTAQQSDISSSVHMRLGTAPAAEPHHRMHITCNIIFAVNNMCWSKVRDGILMMIL